MTLTASQTLITVLAVALGCMITRFAPFVIFPDSKEPPEVVTWLGKVLPAAMMGLLVVYSLKGVSLVSPPHGIPEFLAILVIVLLHRWKHNTLLSIAAGTAVYMLLVQTVYLKKKSLRPTVSRRNFLFAGECFPVRGFSAREGSGESAGAAAERPPVPSRK